MLALCGLGICTPDASAESELSLTLKKTQYTDYQNNSKVQRTTNTNPSYQLSKYLVIRMICSLHVHTADVNANQEEAGDTLCNTQG